jgi:hypothetical protein
VVMVTQQGSKVSLTQVYDHERSREERDNVRTEARPSRVATNCAFLFSPERFTPTHHGYDTPVDNEQHTPTVFYYTHTHNTHTTLRTHLSHRRAL